jgi:hypothetical protein
MLHRFCALVVLLVFAVPGVWLDSGTVTAQTQEASPGIPRTPDGHPDLTGVYDVATMTPVDRPREYGDQLFLTEEEVAEMVQYEEQRNVRDLEPLDPNREAPPVGGNTSPTNSYLEGLFRLGGGTVGGYNLFWLSPGERPVTIDGRARTSLVVDPADGRVPPMTPEAQQRMAELLANRAAPDAGESDAGAGSSSQYDAADRRPLAERCILGFGSTSGPPTLPNYFYNNLKFIVQSGDWVLIYNEMVHDTRMIPIGGEHLPTHVKQWMGNSVGQWDGDTLVVETTNFSDKTRFRGSGEDLKVTERFTLAEDGTILYRFTVEDPTTWDRPWTGEYPWNPTQEEIFEYACHEGNYALDTVLRGARLADKNAAGNGR